MFSSNIASNVVQFTSRPPSMSKHFKGCPPPLRLLPRTAISHQQYHIRRPATPRYHSRFQKQNFHM